MKPPLIAVAVAVVALCLLVLLASGGATAASTATAAAPHQPPQAACGPHDSLPPLQHNGSTGDSSNSNSHQDLLTTLSVVMLFHNLVPARLSHPWALATTAAAWSWLAFQRLQPWLPQTKPPSPETTAATAASGAGELAAAAGLSPAATAAGAVGGVGGDARTRWWQHALLIVELMMGNAVDALLLMGLLLLPLLALQRWWAGKRMWGAVAGLSSNAPSSPALETTPTAHAAAADSDTLMRHSGGGARFRSSFDGVSAQLQSAGHTAARLAKAMRSVGSLSNTARRRRSSPGSGSSSRTSSRASSPHAAGSRPHSPSASSSTGSMVSPEQSVLQPTTPPPLYVGRPDGPLAVPAATSRGTRIAAPLPQASPTQDKIEAGRNAAARAAAAAAALGVDAPMHGASGGSSSSLSPTAAVPPLAASSSNSSIATTTSTEERHAVAGSVATQPVAGPADTGTGSQGAAAAAPAGARTDSGSSAAGAGASLNLGAVGTIRMVSTRAPPPMYPTRALYNSPLETVVISCKLGSTSTSSTSGSATAVQVGGTAASQLYAPASTAQMVPAGAGAGSAAAGVGPPTGGVQVPLSPAQASLAAASSSAQAAASNLATQRQLRAAVEAAVRQAVAASNVSVLSTTVTSFPGCVHVVVTAHLTAAALAAAAAIAGAGGDGASSAATPGTAAAAAESQVAKVAWEQVVQQILTAQAGGSTSASAGGGRSSTGSSTPADASSPGSWEGMFLKHLLVQDGAGNIQYLWLSPQAAAAASEMDSDTSNSSQAGAGASEEGFTHSASPFGSRVSSRVSSRRSSTAAQAEQSSHQQQQLHAAASSISTSSFALPTDGDAAAASAGAAETAPAGGKLSLLLPPQLADALSAANAGLRLVLSGAPQASAHTPAAEAAAPAPTTSSSAGGSGSSEHLLVDHTLWPGSSSWPAGPGAEVVDLLQLLPGGMTGSMLAQLFGPVLTLNIVASTRAPQPADAQPESAAGGASAGGDAPGQAGGAAAGAAARSASAQLHQDIASLLSRLGATSSAGGTTTSASQPEEPEGAAAAQAGEMASEAQHAQQDQHGSLFGEHLLLQLPLLLLPSAACTELELLQQRMAAELDGDAVAAARAHMLPLVNDIAAALSMRPTTLAPASASASAAGAQPGVVSTAAAAALGSAASAQLPVHVLHMDMPAAAAAATEPPQEHAATRETQLQARPTFATEQKHLVKQLLQFMSDQGLDTLAATLCSHLAATWDAAQLLAPSAAGGGSAGSWQQQRDATTAGDTTAAAPAAAAAPAQHSMGLPEIQPADDDAAKTPTAAAAPTRSAGGNSAEADRRSSTTSATSSSAAANNTAVSSPQSPAEAGTEAGSAGSSAAARQSSHSKHAAKAMQQASAAHDQAVDAQRSAAATENALDDVMAVMATLRAAAAAAGRQAADAQAAAAAATQRAAAVEEAAERQRALQLISSPAGAPAPGVRGVGIWGLLSSSSRAVSAARASGSALLGGVMRAAEPPLLPEAVAPRDVLLGFEDERLEVQYRRMKAMQARGIDRAALAMQVFRQVVFTWRIAHVMFISAGTGLSLVLLCKYEAVVLLPYIMMLLTPEFFICHRHLLLCLSQIAAAATVAMIATTEIYRNEWGGLLSHPDSSSSSPTLLARPSMMLLWYYLLVPLLQQQTLPEQALSCLAQLAHSLLLYLYILKGSTSLWLVIPLLLAASGVSFGVSYVLDAWSRQAAIAGARRSLMREGGNAG